MVARRKDIVGRPGGSRVLIAQEGTLSKERGLMPHLLWPWTSQERHAHLGTTWLLRDSDGSLVIDSTENKVDKGARRDKVGGALWPH